MNKMSYDAVNEFLWKHLEKLDMADWCLGWDHDCHGEDIVGYCDETGKTIWMSKWYVDNGMSVVDIKDTILHELAHAIVYEKKGHEVDFDERGMHCRTWRHYARKLGAIWTGYMNDGTSFNDFIEPMPGTMRAFAAEHAIYP